MTNTTPKHDPEQQPYFELAGELVANALALYAQVLSRRPEIAQFGTAPIFTVNATDSTIVIGVQLQGNRIAVVEQIAVDPAVPETFGASVLPIIPASTVTH